jgi:hypothetical protein
LYVIYIRALIAEIAGYPNFILQFSAFVDIFLNFKSGVSSDSIEGVGFPEQLYNC